MFNAITSLTNMQGLGIPPPADWWDFSDTSTLTLTGSDIDSVSNKGLSGNALSYVSGVKATHSTDHAVCNGSQNNYQAGIAGDYDFMHDGSGATVFVVHEQDSTATNEGFLVISRIDSGEGYDIRCDMASNQRYRTILENSTNNNFEANSSDNALTTDLPVIVSSRLGTDGSDNLTMYEDGVEIYNSDDTGFTYGTGSHGQPLRAMVSNKGDVYGILIYDHKLSVEEHNRVLRFLRNYYNLNTTANVVALIGASNAEGLGAGGSLSATYQGLIEKSYILGYKAGNPANAFGLWHFEQANSHVDQTSSNAGLDLSMMYTLQNSSGEKQFLLKSTVSGSDLYAAWNATDFPGSATAWDRFETHVGQMITELHEIGFTAQFSACVIGLGENDASASFRYNDYEDNQGKLNTKIRSITRSDLPIILINCSTENADDTSGRSDGNMGGQSTVRTAQAAIATAEANTVTYQPISGGSTPDYNIGYNESTPNGVHFDMATLEQMGIDIAGLI